MINPEVFREYDIRGVVGKDFNVSFVYDIGRAVGTYAIPHGIRTMTIGMDCRLSSPHYHDALRKGLTST
ncbi:MAG: phosphomannomutase, partial [Syntrophaceae bacterium]|nr:phosphomannomutase [Syntrophaceae bacterium]